MIKVKSTHKIKQIERREKPKSVSLRRSSKYITSISTAILETWISKMGKKKFKMQNLSIHKPYPKKKGTNFLGLFWPHVSKKQKTQTLIPEAPIQLAIINLRSNRDKGMYKIAYQVRIIKTAAYLMFWGIPSGLCVMKIQLLSELKMTCLSGLARHPMKQIWNVLTEKRLSETTWEVRSTER